MTILLVGGGSGGHIMPLLAVARELRERHPDARLIYIGERGGQFSDIPKNSELFDDCYFVYAGKLRRYHGESWFRRFTDLKTIALNIRDIFRLIAGTLQSILLVRKIDADAALLKGGYVCVPLGYACRFAKTPFVTHDSDAIPGLSNRIIGRYASLHAVGLQNVDYQYPKAKTRVVGVPANPEYERHKHPTEVLRKKYRIKANGQCLLVTGGSQGARRLNEAFISILPQLIEQHPKLHVFHHIGAQNADQYSLVSNDVLEHVTRFDFSNELYEMSALADVIITRGGATTLAEFGSQGKACIIVPHPELAGDHQTKNAQTLEDAGAALVVSEAEMKQKKDMLFDAIHYLLRHPKERKLLGDTLASIQPKKLATTALAEVIEELITSGRGSK